MFFSNHAKNHAFFLPQAQTLIRIVYWQHGLQRHQGCTGIRSWHFVAEIPLLPCRRLSLLRSAPLLVLVSHSPILLPTAGGTQACYMSPVPALDNLLPLLPSPKQIAQLTIKACYHQTAAIDRCVLQLPAVCWTDMTNKTRAGCQLLPSIFQNWKFTLKTASHSLHQCVAGWEAVQLHQLLQFFAKNQESQRLLPRKEVAQFWNS